MTVPISPLSCRLATDTYIRGTQSRKQSVQSVQVGNIICSKASKRISFSLQFTFNAFLVRGKDPMQFVSLLAHGTRRTRGLQYTKKVLRSIIVSCRGLMCDYGDNYNDFFP